MKPRNPARMAHYREIIRKALKALLVLAVIGMVFFALRLTMATSVWHTPSGPQDPIAGWMTPRYVAKSWDVPPEIVSQALALEMDGSGRKVTLSELATEQDTDVATLIADLGAAIAAYRATAE
ncbi:hypothetical protein [Yoonia sp.]|uniref:hypothetical protein n=1 Tax=Yoonia sp. TaxID=2212373 RepID=UPI003F6C4A6E